MGLITGSAIGAGLAIYFAPRLALELRERVTDSMTGLRNAASEHFQGVAARVADVVERVADVADDVTRRGQTARDDMADAVARGAHEVGRGAREVEQFARASKTDHGAARS
jgi:gas vesicle protein